MRILGLTSGADPAAAVVVDGVVVAAVQEHRHPDAQRWAVPHRSIAWCLDRAGVPPEQLDGVAVVPALGPVGALPRRVGPCDQTVVGELHALAVATFHGLARPEAAVLVVDAGSRRAVLARGSAAGVGILDEVAQALPLPELAVEACRRAGRPVLGLGGSIVHDGAAMRLLRASDRVETLVVPPVADGCAAAVGAALAVSAQHGVPPVGPVGPYLGPGPARVPTPSALLRETEVADVATAVAAVLHQGGRVGWMQGRAEFGGRPLGRRAVLGPPDRVALPGSGPAVATAIAERAGDWFRCGPARQHRTGSSGIAVRPDCARRLAGVVEDGLAVLHAVDAADDPRLHEVLSRYAALTGVPVLRSTALPADPWGALARGTVDVVATGGSMVEWATPLRHSVHGARARRRVSPSTWAETKTT